MFTHKEVIQLFAQAIPICTMTIYRDSLGESTDVNYEYREGRFKDLLE